MSAQLRPHVRILVDQPSAELRHNQLQKTTQDSVSFDLTGSAASARFSMAMPSSGLVVCAVSPSGVDGPALVCRWWSRGDGSDVQVTDQVEGFLGAAGEPDLV